MRRRFLLLGAGMGAGHAAVSAELARRLRERGDHALVRDVLTLLPPGVGPAVRSSYRATVRYAPWVYEGIYALFMSPAKGPRPSSTPLAVAAERRLMELVELWRPDVVVSTFHLAAELTGRLRAKGTLPVPAAVFLTDLAVHRGWLHPGNDLYVCVTEATAADVRAATGRPAMASGPVVAPAFHTAGTRVPSSHWETDHWETEFARVGFGRAPVLLSTGAWGVGTAIENTARSLAHHGCLPVVLCGRDRVLRRRTTRLPGVLGLGWVADMPQLFASVRVLIDNAAGQTAVQALASGVPVIGYRPIPGHGAEGVRSMAAAGLSVRAGSLPELLRAVDRLARAGTAREEQLARGAAAFTADAAGVIADFFGPRPVQDGDGPG
ncbi:galactosyldiacylglycerol synthase [Streptomyces sp. NPDC015127]|uniref:MGDG synthase family glycosyltransferase n=1 Tax=Streptomyces sp. NPDC015127 TaxID=3364939 RepID=UPI0036FA2E2D